MQLSSGAAATAVNLGVEQDLGKHARSGKKPEDINKEQALASTFARLGTDRK